MKGAVVLVTLATALDTPVPDGMLSRGATDGTTHKCSTWFSDDNVNPSDDEIETSNVVVRIKDATGGATDGIATFSDWVTDGIELNWTEAPSSAYLVTVILFAGTDMQCDCQSLVITAAGSPFDVDCGFVPDGGLCALGTEESSWAGGANVKADNGFGAWSQQGGAASPTIQQYSNGYQSRDGRSPTVLSGGIVDEVVARYRTGTAGQTESYATVTDVLDTGEGDSVSGFQVTHTADHSSIDFSAWFFSFAIAGGAAKVLQVTLPASTGEESLTGAGFEPQAVIGAISQYTTLNSPSTGSNPGSIGIFAFTPDADSALAVAVEDNATVANTTSEMEDGALLLLSDAGAEVAAATLVSLDADGWTWNVNPTSNGALGWGLCIEDVAGGPTTHEESVTEALALTEDAARDASLLRETAQAISLSESPAREAVLIRGVDSALSPTDQVAEIATLPESIGEALALTDDAARTITVEVALSDSLSLSDAAARRADLARAILESVVFVETPVRNAVLSKAVISALTLSDDMGEVAAFPEQAVDTLTLSDEATKTLLEIEVSVSSSLSLADLAAEIATFSEQTSATLTLADVMARIATLYRSRLETLTITDTRASTLPGTAVVVSMTAAPAQMPTLSAVDPQLPTLIVQTPQ